MKLDYPYSRIAQLLGNSPSDETTVITSVAYDTRRLLDGNNVLFFALEGVFRDGHDFIEDAYKIGVRHFVVTQEGITSQLPECHEIVVENSLSALLKFAKHHRNQFNCEVIGITGSAGKTTVKEWLTRLLGKKFKVVRSPKSYNSKLGIALSLLEITRDTEVAIIEVGLSGPSEMIEIKTYVRPTKGILTSFGLAHRELFDSEMQHLNEKLSLFMNLEKFLVPQDVLENPPKNAFEVKNSDYKAILQNLVFSDEINRQNASLAIAMSLELGIDAGTLITTVGELSSLAMRLETFDGVNGNAIINDTYNLDLDSLRVSLEYQLANAKNKDRIVLIGLDVKDPIKEKAIQHIVAEFKPSQLFFHYPDDSGNYKFKNSSVLIKGSRLAKMEKVAREFKHQNHQTYLEIDLKAIRHNINYYKSLIEESTKVLCMVKASSYGSDAQKIGAFLEGIGVDYLGVAYPDEGVELRNNGVRTPILVMNCEEKSFSQCIEYNLEPAFFSINQLDAFIKELISQTIYNYPVHLKIETGMNRLGFSADDLSIVVDLVKGQPEIIIKSVYSHLAEADNKSSDFTRQQIETFKKLSSSICGEFAYPIMRHLLNSEGIVNYSEAQFDMVRLGIGMYGVTKLNNLRPSISWISSISQIKKIKKGDSVGYSRGFVAEQEMIIAIIPVGYADGFRRALGNGAGGVFVKENYCPTVGNVCMDMIMIDVSKVATTEGQSVELIGAHQSVFDLAEKMGTIPYEIMTSFSTRIHRVYIDQ